MPHDTSSAAEPRTLNGKFEAFEVHNNILLAYWMHETPEEPGFHLQHAHQSFQELAKQLGYRVERIDEAEA